MKEVCASKYYLFSLWLKILLVLIIFWGTVHMILNLLDSVGLKIELSSGQNNSVVIFTLLIITFAIAGIGAFLFYTFIIKPKTLYIDERGIKISEGILNKKEKYIDYVQITDAHCDEDNLALIDKIFKIKVIKIHGTDTFYFPGILNADDIVKEMKTSISSRKEKKVDPISVLSEEIVELKKEMTELKGLVEEFKKVVKEKETKKSTPKKRFTLGPFEEEIGE
ncbi:MAG: hypothetical protein N3G74_02270 [Candidatus Micrarchaeota archaeon]|nr:hypothetical protein [Candidatus Micrarchaeota archaeon]